MIEERRREKEKQELMMLFSLLVLSSREHRLAAIILIYVIKLFGWTRCKIERKPASSPPSAISARDLKCKTDVQNKYIYMNNG